MNIEKLKIRYIFEESTQPDDDLMKIFMDIREFFFTNWLEDVFFVEYDEQGYELWNDEPESVIDTFIDTNKKQITQYMTDLQKKLFFHPEKQEEFKDVLAGAEV